MRVIGPETRGMSCTSSSATNRPIYSSQSTTTRWRAVATVADGGGGGGGGSLLHAGNSSVESKISVEAKCTRPCWPPGLAAFAMHQLPGLGERVPWSVMADNPATPLDAGFREC